MLYSKRSKKKMAQGGMAKNDSAKTEQRPVPSETDNDSAMVSRNSGNKPPKDDSSTSNVTVSQAQKPSITPLSRPKMVGSDSFSVRDRDDVDKDLRRMSSEAPDGYGKQPNTRYNEKDADKSGPVVPDMQSQHNNKKAPYQKAVEHEYSEDVADPMFKQPKQYAQGGIVGDDSSDVPTDEADQERHASIAAAIMAKKDRLKAHIDSGSADMDEMVRMYEGGQVEGSNEGQADIMQNGAEQPNGYYPRNENEVLKENYISDMEGVDQPEDSNLIDDPREEAKSDPHDMVDAIMRKRKSKK